MPHTKRDFESYLKFDLGTKSYAVELLRVKEVLNSASLIKKAESPSHVRGLCEADGNIVTVINMREKLKMNELGNADQKNIIIFDLGEHTFGIEVDYIREIVVVNKSKIKSSHKKMAHLTNGMIDHANCLTPILCPFKIMKPQFESDKRAA